MMTEEKHKKKFEFKAETRQILDLMINSLYSNKEIFLRELIANASDAADKLRFAGIENPDVYENDPDLKVYIDFDAKNKTITIKDNGIGMTCEEVINNLGTIAKSGTKEFLDQISKSQNKTSELIGQFGVGFYSSFIVAEKVIVNTRKANTSPDSGTQWSSNGSGEYEINNINKEARGTEVVLHLKKEEDEFLNNWKLRQIVTKYADHISLPIIMKKEVVESEQATDEEKDKDKDKEAKQEKKEPVEEVINKAQALWTKSKSEIKDEQYKELYKHIAHDFEDPLIWAHNKVEGKFEYISLLYIPARAPFDLWHANKSRGLKLYVQRVFIMDEAEQLLPSYLRFVKGIIDSNDLPLNVSRELLQSSRIVDKIKSATVKRILDLLSKLASNNPEKYTKFWNEFGQVLKEGPAEDFSNKEQIAKLLRFSSTHTNSKEQTVSLDDYLSRMPEKQEHIYYVSADSFNAAKNSPHLEIFRKKDIEVLIFFDRIDEWLITHLNEYSGKKLQSVARGGLDLGKLTDKVDEEVNKEIQEEFKDVVEKMKKLLNDKVKDVRTTNRLTDSPACLIIDENDMSSQMEQIMRAAGQNVPKTKHILEINPQHKIVGQLKNEDNFEDLAHVIFDQAVLAGGGQLDNPAEFVRKLNTLLL